MTLLYDEPPIVIPPPLAKAFGLAAGAFIQRLHMLLEAKAKNPQKYADSFADGHFWVYDSAPKWLARMPYLGSEPTFKRMIADLRKQGVLIVASHNRHGFDKTSWYRLDYPQLREIVEQENNPQTPEVIRPLDQNDTTTVSKRSDAEYQSDTTNTNTLQGSSTQQANQPSPVGSPTRLAGSFDEISDEEEIRGAEQAGHPFPIHDPKGSVTESQRLRDSMIALGIHPLDAERLIVVHGREACQQQVDWLPLRQDVKIAARYLKKAIEKRFEPPASVMLEREAAAAAGRAQGQHPADEHDPVLLERQLRQERAEQLYAAWQAGKETLSTLITDDNGKLWRIDDITPETQTIVLSDQHGQQRKFGLLLVADWPWDQIGNSTEETA